MSGIAFVFTAEQTGWITGFLCLSGFCDISWILLRLGQIDRNIDWTVFRFRNPFFILCDTVFTNIVCSLAESIIIIRCFLWGYSIFISKYFPYNGWSRSEHTHDLCIEKITVCDRVILHQFMPVCII